MNPLFFFFRWEKVPTFTQTLSHKRTPQLPILDQHICWVTVWLNWVCFLPFQLSDSAFRWFGGEPVTFQLWQQTLSVDTKYFVDKFISLNVPSHPIYNSLSDPEHGLLCAREVVNKLKQRINFSEHLVQSSVASTCVLITLVQVEYPYWISISCFKPILSSVTCQYHANDFHNHKHKSTSDNLQCTCGGSFLVFNDICFALVIRHDESTIEDLKKISKSKIQVYISNLFPAHVYSFFGHSEHQAEHFEIVLSSPKGNFPQMENTFNCKHGGLLISSSGVCDGVLDCPDSDRSDEDHCHTPVSMSNDSSATKVNPNRTQCGINLMKTTQGQCVSIRSTTNQRQKERKGTQVKPGDTLKTFHCFNAKEQLFLFNQRCHYQIDEKGHISFCSNGLHLGKCSTFQCSEKYKCPESYCIDYSYVCNERWDCLHGWDERDCDIFSCSGLFQCKHNSICVHLQNVCDGEAHCPAGDDEMMCDLIPCDVVNCICLNYAVTCVNSKTFGDFLSELGHIHFVYILAENSLPNVVAKTLNLIQSVIFLEIPNNEIETICTGSAAQNALILFNVNTNKLLLLTQKCFQAFPRLKVLKLKSNKLSVIHSRAFGSLRYLSSVDLSDNFIEEIKPFIFSGLNEVKFIAIKQNKTFSTISTRAFDESVSPVHVVTSDHNLCCVVPHECKTDTFVQTECHRILFSKGLNVLAWLFGILVFAVNVVSLSIFKRQFLQYQEHKSGHWVITQVMLVNGILFSVTDFMLSVTDSFYGQLYLEALLSRRSGMFCFVVGFFLLFEWLLSVFVTSFLVHARYCIAANPLKTTMKHEDQVRKHVGHIFIATMIGTATIAGGHHLYVGYHLLSMPLCSILGNNNPSFFTLVVTTSASCLLICCTALFFGLFM